MSDFMLLSADSSLWETMTKLGWGVHDFCLVVTNFQVRAITQAQLDILSLVMVWEDTKKPLWDMVFLLITLSNTSGYERIFGLVTVWAHPCQACYTTLADATHKLILVMDGRANLVYAFVQLNEVLSHAPLSSVGLISTMTDGAPPHTLMANSISFKCISCYSVSTSWCVQKVSMAR